MGENMLPNDEQITGLWERAEQRGMTRRKFLALLAAGGTTAVLAACGAPSTKSTSSAITSTASPSPKTVSTGRGPVDESKRIVGLLKNDPRAWPGITLFAPKHYTYTYLIDNKGNKVHEWTKGSYEPGQAFYLLENGHLIRAAMVGGPLGSGGGEGGRLEEYDWDGKLYWELDFNTADYKQHHDFQVLPNGNVIMLVVEKKTTDQAIAAGFNPIKISNEIKGKGWMVPDAVYEVKPTPPKGGEIVWKWSVWDHLVQDFDATKANYGNPAEHPELIDPNTAVVPSFWNHMNAIYWHPVWNQIMLSVRGSSEAWVIDHSTTTAEAASHRGGKFGKGGDLIYRWGNPLQYRAGTKEDQRLYEQHNTYWIPAGYPGAGNVLCYNNGVGRNYSTVDEWKLPVDANGNYAQEKGKAYEPKDFLWSYKADPPKAMYDHDISGAQRLPNGNTLIDSGTSGRFIEVTPQGETVWEYKCPVQKTGPMKYDQQPDRDAARATEYMNAVFRVLRYPLDYPAFKGRDLTPVGPIETS